MKDGIKAILKYIMFLVSVCFMSIGITKIREEGFGIGWLFLFMGVIYPNHIAINYIFRKK